MIETTPSGLNRPVEGEGGTARAIRHAVHLTGGLVMLAFGVSEVASTLGQILNCVAQTTFCPGSPNEFYYETLPTLAGGIFLLLVAAVLFVWARRTR
jgi:hypothetical protein